MIVTNTHLIESMKSRRSLRRYQPRPVPREIIEAVLDAAIWAPSAHNRQPWRFVVVDTDATKRHLAASMGERLRQDLEADHVPQAIIEKDVSRSYERITMAPVIIMLCLTMEDMDHYTDEKRNRHELTMAVQSVAMAGQNLLLAAHSLGLGACWMCAPLFCADVVQDVLELEKGWQPQGMITLGYPAQKRDKTRHPLDTKVLWR